MHLATFITSHYINFITSKDASQTATELDCQLAAQRQPRLPDTVYFAPHSGEDQLKNILNKQNNESYKPWKNQYAPKNPHSPFGDFPKEYLPKEKVKETSHEPVHELTLSGSLAKHTKQSGNGGRNSSTL